MKTVQSEMPVSRYLLWLPLICGVFLPSAYATYSIVACDSQTRQCGVAVQTNNLAVGASVPYAEAGVGAVASQFETNPKYGPRGLSLMSEGKSPDDTLKQLLREDGNFDGSGIESRQVGIVAVDGRAAFYTGQEAADSPWAGGRSGKGCSIQGNGLAGPHVVEAMEHAFLKTSGPLADRLLAALVAGDAAGGQRTGRESAALLVRTPEGFPLDIDLRVDDASDPVAELQKLYDMQSARQQVIEAGIAVRRGQLEQARSLMIAAAARAHSRPRTLIQAAKVAQSIEEPELALQYIISAFSQNPAWVQEEIGSGDYAQLGSSPRFHRWVTADQEQRALSVYRELRAKKEIALQDRLRIGSMLLEAGDSSEALALLNIQAAGSDESVDLDLLRAVADSANGDYHRAIADCEAAALKAPHDPRVRLRIDRLRQHTDTLEKTQ